MWHAIAATGFLAAYIMGASVIGYTLSNNRRAIVRALRKGR